MSHESTPNFDSKIDILISRFIRHQTYLTIHQVKISTPFIQEIYTHKIANNTKVPKSLCHTNFSKWEEASIAIFFSFLTNENVSLWWKGWCLDISYSLTNFFPPLFLSISLFLTNKKNLCRISSINTLTLRWGFH